MFPLTFCGLLAVWCWQRYIPHCGVLDLFILGGLLILGNIALISSVFGKEPKRSLAYIKKNKADKHKRPTEFHSVGLLLYGKPLAGRVVQKKAYADDVDKKLPLLK